MLQKKLEDARSGVGGPRPDSAEIHDSRERNPTPSTSRSTLKRPRPVEESQVEEVGADEADVMLSQRRHSTTASESETWRQSEVFGYPMDLSTTLSGIHAGLLQSETAQASGSWEPGSSATLGHESLDQSSRTKARATEAGPSSKKVKWQISPLAEAEFALGDRMQTTDLGLTVMALVRTVLDDEKVEEMYRIFFDNLNTYIALLDPALHTPAYCLSSSPILYLSILVVTSMVYASSLYDFLFNTANRILADSFATGHVSVGLCQSLSLLSVWKKPSDQNAWLRVGYAIRAAYQLKLDAPPVRPLPSNAQEAREVLNRERTFRQLALFDRTMYVLHGRFQRMISPEVVWQLRLWVRDHPEYYCYADGMLAGSNPHSEALTHTAFGGDISFDTAGFVALNMRSELKTWRETWLGSNPPARLHPTSRTILGFYSLTNAYETTELMGRLAEFKGRTELRADMLSQSVAILRYTVSDLGPAGVLMYAPDFITFQIAKAAYLLAKKMSEMTLGMADDVLKLLNEVSQTYDGIDPKNEPVAYASQFFMNLSRLALTRWQMAGGGVTAPATETVPTRLSAIGGLDTEASWLQSYATVLDFAEQDPNELEWHDLLEDFERWLPDDYLPRIEDFGWADYDTGEK